MDRLKKMSPEELMALKEKAVAFYMKNGVPKKMEEALNSMFFDSPSDVYGYLVNFFKKQCPPPVIEQVTCKPTISSNGEISTELQLYGKFANISQLYATVTVSPLSTLELVADQSGETNALRTFVNEHVPRILALNADLLANFRNGDADKAIYDIFRNKENELEAEWKKDKQVEQLLAPSESTATVPETTTKKGKGAEKVKTATKRPVPTVVEAPPRLQGLSVVSALSRLLCSAAARSVEKTPYELVKEAFPSSARPTQQRKNFLPLMVISQNGKAASGKLKCFKEVFLIFNPTRSLDTNLTDFAKVFDTYRVKAFGAKAGIGALSPSKLATEMGSVSPPMDRPEQLLDLLMETCADCALRPGVDLLFGINCAGHEVFDWDKGKYDFVSGAGKTADDGADFWADLVTRYPIAILIDPLRKEDALSWQKLGEKICGKSFLFADHALGVRLDRLAMGEMPERSSSTLPSETVQQAPAPEPAAAPVGGKASQSRRPSTGGTAITVGTTLTNTPPVAPIPPCASGVILRMDGSNLMTVYGAAKLAEYLHENNLMTMMYAHSTDGSDTTVDLALGLRAHSLLMGGVNRGERAALFNKWHSYSTKFELVAPSLSEIIPSERCALFTDQNS